jgi:flagellar secretion chaperone FliS
MQQMRRAVSAYGQAAETLAPAQQIVLLYDGAIRRIKEARDAIGRRAIRDRHAAVSKAAAIVDALHACLDHEQGGEIATNLDRLYTYFGLRLQQINLGDDVRICDELVARLGELRASWAQIADRAAAAGAAGPGPAPAGARPAEAGTAVTI